MCFDSPLPGILATSLGSAIFAFPFSRLSKHVAVRYTQSSLLKNHKGENWKLVPVMVLFPLYLLCQAVSLFASLSLLPHVPDVGLPPFDRFCAEGAAKSVESWSVPRALPVWCKLVTTVFLILCFIFLFIPLLLLSVNVRLKFWQVAFLQ